MKKRISTKPRNFLVKRLVLFAALVCFTCQLSFAQKQDPNFKSDGTPIALGDFDFPATSEKTQDLDNTFFEYEIYNFSETKAIRSIVSNRKNDIASFNINLGADNQILFTVWPADLFSPDFEFHTLTEAGKQAQEFNTDIAFQGYVNGDPNQRLRLTITDDIFYAWFELKGEEYFIEPLWYLDQRLDKEPHIFYKKSNVMPTPHLTCGNEDAEEAIRRLQEPSLVEIEKGSGCFESEIGLAGAFDMVGKYGSTGAVGVKMTGVTNNIQPLYDGGGLGITYIIVDIVVPASSAADPWDPSTCMTPLLASFVGWAPAGFVTHDIGQLWVNRDVMRGDPGPCTITSLIGRAAGLGTVCTSLRYNCCEDWQSTNAAAQAHLSAHECGHDWNGLHSLAGNSNDIMWPSLSSASPNTVWSAANIANIIAHRDSRTCLASCGAPPNDLCSAAIPIACGSSTTVDISNSTNSDNPGTCVTFGGSEPGVWYSIPGTGGNINITTCNPGTNYDTKITVWSGACGALTCVTGNDDQLGGTDPACDVTGIGFNRGSTVDFCSSIGTTYYVYLYGFASLVGTAQMTVTCDPPVVQCPLPGPILLECINQLPPGPTTVADFLALGGQISGFCTNTPFVSFFDTDDLGAGCVGAKRTVLRTITVFEPNTQTFVQCTIEYIFVDETPPLVFCPPPITIECDEESEPINTSALLNGGFESGSYAGWNVVDIANPFIPATVSCAPFSVGFGFYPIYPLEGSCYALNGFDGGGPGTISTCQTMTFGDYDETLNFSFWAAYDLITFGATIDRFFEVYVDGNLVFNYTAFAGTFEPGTGWMSVSVPIGAFAGQTVNVCFDEFIPQNFSGPAQVGIDNVFVGTHVGVPTAFDNCQAAAVLSWTDVVAPGACSVEETITRIWTATDACGLQASCQQLITVQSTEPPMVTCPAPVTVECAADIVVSPSDVTVTTQCGQSFTTVVGPASVSSYPDCPGTTHTYEFTVTDECGNVASCSRVFVIQNDPPEIICPPDMTIECADEIVVDELLTTVISSCDQWVAIDPVGPTLVSGQDGCDGAIYEVTYLLEDACGRTDLCTQRWTLDNAAPLITVCPPDRTVECSFDAIPQPELLQAIIACDLDYDVTWFGPIPLDNLGTCPGAQYEITYYVTDECGRQDQCTQTYTVDNPPPRVFPPDGRDITCFSETNGQFFDNCYYESSCFIPIVATELIGPVYDTSAAFCQGSIVNYLYTVWDACGRMTCEAQVFRFNFENAITVEDVTVDCNNIPVPATLNSCVDASLNIDEGQVPLGGNDYQILREYTLTDPCGNTFSFYQTITVLCDNSPELREYCSYTQEQWGDAEWLEHIVYNFDGSILDAENPIILGDPSESAMLINSLECVEDLLPGYGRARGFPAGLGLMQTSFADCQPEPLVFEDDGSFVNGLAAQTLALALNCRLDPELDKVYLGLMCDGIPYSVWEIVGPHGRVEDLVEAANGGLAGQHDNPDDLLYALKLVNRYFNGCRAAPCHDTADTPDDPSGDVHTPPATFGNTPLSFELSAFPNPTVDEVTIEIGSEMESEVHLKLFDATGSVVLEKFVQTNKGQTKESWDLGNYPG
ncbi:MAG: hypothetical protein HKN16_05375, partial [Saprospiraceae bacterium]|nr:hypothetical protein [Saprospiraceae bacterium]